MVIMGIQVGNREHDAIKLQELLTKYGCIIKTRLGVHEATVEGLCASKGLIILEFITGKEKDILALESELHALESITVRKMEF